MIEAARVPVDVDLLGFSEALERQGIRHRVIEEAGFQVIKAPTEDEARMVREALRHWRELGNEHWRRPRNEERRWRPALLRFRRPLVRLARPRNEERRWRPALPAGDMSREFFHCPVTIVLMLICAAVAFWSRLGGEAWRVGFLFYPMLASDSLVELLGGLGSPVILARTITPMFLHFGELHLIFNMLWLWYFGRQLEPLRPAWIYPAVVLLTSFVANTAQYLLGGGSNFGGMSGVVYGLVGYAWILHRFSPRSGLLLNDQMFLFFVIMLVAMEVFASSWIATAAHLGGLLAGLFLGIVFAVFRRT